MYDTVVERETECQVDYNLSLINFLMFGVWMKLLSRNNNNNIKHQLGVAENGEVRDEKLLYN